MMRYVSTRDADSGRSFADVVLSGLASDGGLYVPEAWPVLDRPHLERMAGLSYAEIAMRIVRPFVEGSVDDDSLQKMVEATYSRGVFDHAGIAPLTQLGPSAWLLELFHGPTLSFKDYALQLLGRLFDHILASRGERITIIGATSGDTGSAAIEACRHCRNVEIFILHPHGRISDAQRRQMTTVNAPNVHNIALEGSFDDCQAIVKALFADEKLRQDYGLSAVNSINWARIMAQTVYYATAALALGAPGRAVSFAVPTGNFGNIYAGWAARRMGLPIHRLVVASNRNDILTRFFESGDMRSEAVVPSLSPSMDIQASSNFERYLFELTGRDHAAVGKMMLDFANRKSFSLNSLLAERAREDFAAVRCGDTQTLDMMRACHAETGLLIDPHTAVGLHAAMQAVRRDPDVPMVVAATAHPAKFPDAVKQATGLSPFIPDRLATVMKKKEDFTILSSEINKVKDFIRARARRI